MILFKKAMRSVWRGKRSYIACVILMGIGVMVYTAFNLLFINLNFAKDKMYEDQRFADAFAKVRGIPLNAADSLDVDGVAETQGRIAADARVLIPGKEEKIITLRIHSFDPAQAEPLNAFLITRGTSPGENEILVGEPFFKANGLSAGDNLTTIINGKRIDFIISGAAQSPEYVYAIPDTGQLMPDNEAFGFAFVTYEQLASVTGEQGLANLLAFRLDDGAGFDNVKSQLEDALAPYGLISLYGRKDHPSAEMLNQELKSLGGMSTSMPMLFILIAVVILYIMLKRVIEQERGSIGTLKAFGYSDAQVLSHYMCYGLIAGGAGGLTGCALGLMMSGGFTQIYLDFFNLPALKAAANPVFLLNGMLISLASGAFGAFMGTRSVLKLNPSEAMRPPTPHIMKNDIFSSLPFLKTLLASNGFMAMRNIERNRFRSLFIVMGVALSFSLIGFTSSYPDMMDKMLIEQFTKVLLYDVKISLKEPKAYTGAIEAALGIGGISAAEAVLDVPAEIRSRNLSEQLAITALESDSKLQRIYDSEGGFYLRPPEGGLIISDMLANKIGAKRGDTLMVKTPYTGTDEIPVPVLGIVNENLGMTAYMELGAMCGLLGVPKSVNSILLSTPDARNVKLALDSADNVSAVTNQEDTRKIYDDMTRSYSSIYTMLNLAGMAVAYAIIATTSSISLSERKREYATLRVLGMNPREIAKILGFEYWLLAIIGIIPGIPLVRALKTGMSSMVDTSMFTIPLSTPLNCYLTAAAGCLFTVAACNYLSSRQIAKFDMVDVLKERE